MKDRGKSAAMKTIYDENNKFSDFNYSVSSDMLCMKHPNSSPIGICSFCLKDRLMNLVYSDQCFSDDYNTDRSSYSSYRNSSSVEVGSVGRISFLLENEKQSKTEQVENQKQRKTEQIENEKQGKTEQVILLRSNSNSVEIKKNRNGFWKIKRLFKKNIKMGDEKSDISVPIGGVCSRSRSLCSFRNGDDGGSENYRFSSAKISDVTGGLFFDYSDNIEQRKCENSGDSKNPREKIPNSELCCSDSCRILKKRATFGGSDVHQATFLKSPSNINSDRGNFFQGKESDFTTTTTMDDDDDSGFIDLKLDLSSSLISEPKLEVFSGKRLSNCSDFGYDYANSMGNLRGGSCRMMDEYDRRMKRGNRGKGNKVWKWIFRKSSTSKRDEINSNLIIKS
ncbi:uncharacterized protein LOC132067753 [Lycium ferocissimum]|uniref:uncharacterized protein LOC132067753 n=1 Tax=Lycium ferocissimum TaxID=112874 RepID=UPI00281518E4|nr:uncharacterized protein LOC132067753 [Lycium ferocissimum]